MIISLQKVLHCKKNILFCFSGNCTEDLSLSTNCLVESRNCFVCTLFDILHQIINVNICRVIFLKLNNDKTKTKYYLIHYFKTLLNLQFRVLSYITFNITYFHNNIFIAQQAVATRILDNWRNHRQWDFGESKMG